MIDSSLSIRSDYEYAVRKFVIAIKDLDKGRMSVTNNIENIVAKICETHNLEPIEYTIIYSDSEGEIAEFYWLTRSFKSIEPFYKNKCKALIP